MSHKNRMNYLILFLFFLSLQSTQGTQAAQTMANDQASAHSITLFMAPIDPHNLKAQYPLDSRVEKRPDSVTRAIFKAKFNPQLNTTNRGVFVTYAGMSDTLNFNGQVTFPRQHQKDSVTLIVTQTIKPVIIRGNNVKYFVRDEKYPIAYYQTTRLFDATNEIYYWETKKIQQPTDPKIPASAFVIIARPDEIYIPEGTTLAMGGPNLLLPLIYPTQNLALNKNEDALFFLKINNYFAPVHFIYKTSTERYAQMIQS